MRARQCTRAEHIVHRNWHDVLGGLYFQLNKKSPHSQILIENLRNHIA